MSVALVLVPQGLAYADLAGLPAYYGLYAAALPPLAAAFFASSPYLQTGPVALTSLLTFGALASLAAPGTREWIALAALLALIVGAVRIAVGLMRGGWVSYLMSPPLLMGFTSAAAILIVSAQLPTALGVSSPDGHLLYRAVWALMHPGRWELSALAFSIMTVVLVRGGPLLHRLFPGVLLAVVLGTGYAAWFGYGGEMIGEVPAGLPPFSLAVPWGSLPRLLVPGAVIALVGFAEASAIARTLAAQERMPWDPNREFVSQGVANLASGISGGFPVGGSFSRSSLTHVSGGRTRWSGAVTGLAVLAFLPVAGILAPLPRAVLAAIVIAAVLKLIKFRALVRIHQYSRLNSGIAWMTFLATLVLAPHIELAVLVGVVLAASHHIWRELRVHIRTSYQDATLRLEPIGVLFFGSAPYLDEILNRELAKHPDAERLVIDLGQLGRIDYSGAEVLHTVVEESVRAGLETRLVSVPPHAARIVERVVGEKYLE